MLTGRENLQLVGRLYHLGRAERRQRTVRLLEQVQLAGAAGRPVRTYSGGTRRRPCRRPAHRGRRPNDKSLPARPGRETLGRSRGGLGTKIHLAADRRCRLVSRILRPGQHGDCPRFIPLTDAVPIARRGLGRPRTRPGAAMADKAYSSAVNCAYLRKRGIKAVIPAKEDQKGAPPRPRQRGRPPARLQRRALQRAQHRRALFLQVQAVPRRRAPVRQA